MTGPAAHEITIIKVWRLDGLDWYRTTCNCGKYRSGAHGSPGRAEAAGNDHVTSKNGAQQ